MYNLMRYRVQIKLLQESHQYATTAKLYTNGHQSVTHEKTGNIEDPKKLLIKIWFLK